LMINENKHFVRKRQKTVAYARWFY
jgi:hypothetical protein